MSGLPLNAQLTDLGGRFLRTEHTRPEYRFYALGERPGLVRTAGGTSIEGEIWILPTTAIGALLARIPAPLGFGTVALATGDCLGFLAESEAMSSAIEITNLGNWRAWINSRSLGTPAR
jgi:allophanate hydrolase